MLEGLGAALAFALYRQRQASATASTSTTGTTSSNGAVPADQVPDVIIQNTLPGPGTSGSTTGGTTGGTSPTPPPVTTPTPPKRPTSITANGEDSGDINRIAISYGLTEKQLIAANPQLKNVKVNVNGKTVKLIGSGQPVPKGTVLKIPPLPSK
jgi:LysM repeat protein